MMRVYVVLDSRKEEEFFLRLGVVYTGVYGVLIPCVYVFGCIRRRGEKRV